MSVFITSVPTILHSSKKLPLAVQFLNKDFFRRNFVSFVKVEERFCKVKIWKAAPCNTLAETGRLSS